MNNMDYYDWLDKIKKGNCILKAIPKEMRNFDICIEAIKNRCGFLADVPPKLLNRDMYYNAVRADGRQLKDVPH